MRQDIFASEYWHGKTVQLLNRASGTVLDLAGGSSTNSTPAQGWTYIQGNPNLSWILERTKPENAWSTWTLRNKSGGTVLDLEAGNTADGTRVIGYERGAGKKWQEWYLITDQNGDQSVFMLQNAMTFTFLDLNGGGRDCGTKVQGYRRNESDAQMWKFLVL